MQGEQVSAGLQRSYCGWECDGKGGRDTECTGRLAGQNAAADQLQPRALGMLCTTIWNVPCFSAGRMEPSPAVQHENVLGAALFSRKLNRDGLSSTSKQT